MDKTCPQCNGVLVAARVPTDAQYHAAFDRENQHSLPFGSDTASPEFRAEFGALYRCRECDYQTRIPSA